MFIYMHKPSLLEHDDGFGAVGYVVVPQDETIHGQVFLATAVGDSKRTKKSEPSKHGGTFTATCTITIDTKRT